MKRYVGRIVLAVAAVLFVGVLVALFQRSSRPPQPPGKKVSVVLYGQSAERWLALEQGVAQACAELSLERPVISVRTAPGLSEAEDQMGRIRREVDAGADGLLVAAADSADMQQALEQLDINIPVVMVETGVGILPVVSADDADMGRALARRIHENLPGGTVLVCKAALERDSVAARHTAFLAEAEALGLAAAEVALDGADDPANSLLEGIAAHKPQVLVALDNDTLELAGGINYSAGLPLYGIGSSGQVIQQVDKGQVTELCYQNEFVIGYTALMQLAGEMGMGAAAPPAAIEFQMVNRNNLYDPAVERLAFPIIQ